MSNRPRLSMVMLAPPFGDSFLPNLAEALRPWLNVEVLVTNTQEEVFEPIARNQIIWIEWADQIAAILTRTHPHLLADKRVIVRLHSFEAFDGTAERVDFSLVDDLVFVAPHIKDIIVNKKLCSPQRTRMHIIPNGVDLNQFKPTQRTPGKRIAYLGNLSYKKDPMTMLHAFREVLKHYPESTLHIAGRIGNLRYELGLNRYVDDNGLRGSIYHEGYVNDVSGWLADKDFILLSSVMEGHPVGALEAMSCGVIPLIYAWAGSENLFPPEFLWRNFDELIQKLDTKLSPDEVRRFVRNNYTLGRQAGLTRSMLLDQQLIEFQGYRWP